jgi:hypothetical protein
MIMNKKLFIYPCFVFLCFLVSCGNSEGEKRAAVDTSEFKTETLEGYFQISIPKKMKKTSQLNSEASMQFENNHNNTFLVILQEDKSDFLKAYGEAGYLDNTMSDIENYRKLQVDYFIKRLTVLEKGEPDAVKINGKNAAQIEFTCQVPTANSNIFYVMTFVESEDDLYMIISWTLSLLEDEHKDSFYAMANSFKTL